MIDADAFERRTIDEAIRNMDMDTLDDALLDGAYQNFPKQVRVKLLTALRDGDVAEAGAVLDQIIRRYLANTKPIISKVEEYVNHYEENKELARAEEKYEAKKEAA